MNPRSAIQIHALNVPSQLRTVCVRFKIVCNTAKERVSTKVDAQHANDRASFQVADMVEDLIYLESVSNRYLDGVGCSQRVQMKCLLHTLSL